MKTRLLGLFSVALSMFSPVAAVADRTLIVNVNIFNGVDDKLISDCGVLIEENRIENACFQAEAPDNAYVIDGRGKTLMPGLISSHVHLTSTMSVGGTKAREAMTWEEIGAMAASSAKEYLMMGFTTVRDMGGMADGFKRAIDAGLLEGPRIYPAGAHISQTGGHADARLRSQPNSQLGSVQYNNLERLNIVRIADGVPNVLLAVRDNFANGAVYIKIHAGGGVSSERDPLDTVQYSMEELQAANDAVQNWGTYWTVHSYNSNTTNRALDAGARCIDHGQLIDEKTMRRIKSEGVFLVSNLSGMNEALLRHPFYGDPNNPSHIKTKQFIFGSKGFADLVREIEPKWVFGDDTVNSTQTFVRQHIDHEKWFAGELFGNFYALKGMTSTAGELAQLTGPRNPYPGKLGVIETGAYADILIVEGNPLEDLSAIGADSGWFDAEPRSQDVPSIRVIMKDGVIYKNTLDTVD